MLYLPFSRFNSPPQAPKIFGVLHRFLIENYHFIKRNDKENPFFPDYRPKNVNGAKLGGKALEGAVKR